MLEIRDGLRSNPGVDTVCLMVENTRVMVGLTAVPDIKLATFGLPIRGIRKASLT